jgi:polysaccharide export outer membrane protein
MMHRLKRILLYALFTAAVLLVPLPEAGVAQVNMQQMPNYSSGPSSAAATTRNRANVPAAVPNSDLRMVPEDFAKLKLAPGFLLSLNVLEDSDFAGTFRIDDLGDIIVPILGTVHVAGETAAEARGQIKKRLLDEQFMNDPQVTLTVVEYTAPEVTIIGEVTSPGKYSLLVPHKLVDVLALAGGLTLLAGNEVQIISNSKPAEPVLVHYSKGSDPQTIENVLVYPGDTVQVKRAGIVYVLGAVTRPGGYVMQEDGTLNVLQAISLAYGTAATASTKTIYLMRRNADGTEVDIALPFNKMLHGQRTDVQLQPTDVLYVPTSKIKAILTNSQTILSSAASASIYAAMY